MRRVLTRHALDRFRRRIDRHATDDQVQAELDAGELKTGPPPNDPTSTAHYRYDMIGYVVTGRAVFPLRRGHEPDVVVAMTALRVQRERRSKADRRAWRDEQREAQL